MFDKINKILMDENDLPIILYLKQDIDSEKKLQFYGILGKYNINLLSGNINQDIESKNENPLNYIKSMNKIDRVRVDVRSMYAIDEIKIDELIEDISKINGLELKLMKSEEGDTHSQLVLSLACQVYKFNEEKSQNKSNKMNWRGKNKVRNLFD